MPPRKRQSADEDDTTLAEMIPKKRNKNQEPQPEQSEDSSSFGDESEELEDAIEESSSDDEEDPNFHGGDGADKSSSEDDDNEQLVAEEEIQKVNTRSVRGGNSKGNTRIKLIRMDRKPNVVKRVLRKEVACKMGTKVYETLESRSNSRALVDTIEMLSENQKESVKELGFGSILDLKIKCLPSYLTYWLVNNFDAEKVGLKMGNGEIVYIEEKDVHIALGIPLGGKDISTKDRVENVEFVEEWKDVFRHKKKDTKFFKITPKDLREEMLADRDGGLFFKRCFINFVISSLLDSKANGSINYSYLSCLEDVENIKNLNWCGLLLDCLVDAKNAWDVQKKNSFTGSLLFLMLFYVDRVQYGRERKDRKIPVFLEWTDDALKKRQKDEMNASGFGHGRVIEQQKIPQGCNNNSLPTPQEEQGDGLPTPQEAGSHVVRLQKWLQSFTRTMERVATELIQLSNMAKDTPSEFLSDPTMKTMHDTAKKLMGVTPQEEEVQGNDTYEELENIWSQSQHPFWNCPELQQCLQQIDKAFSSKQELKKMEDIPPPPPCERMNFEIPSFDLGLTPPCEGMNFEDIGDIASEYRHMDDESLEATNTNERSEQVVKAGPQSKGKVVGQTTSPKLAKKGIVIGDKAPTESSVPAEKDAAKSKEKGKHVAPTESSMPVEKDAAKSKEKGKHVAEAGPQSKDAKGKGKMTSIGEQKGPVDTRVLRSQQDTAVTQAVKPPPVAPKKNKGKEKVTECDEGAKLVIRKAQGTISIGTKKQGQAQVKQPLEKGAPKKARTQPKRSVIIPEALRSPFYDRVIKPGKSFTKEQKDIVKYALFEDKENIPVFLCGHVQLIRSELATMDPTTVIDLKVMDVWTMLLNDKEQRRATGSPYRLLWILM